MRVVDLTEEHMRFVTLCTHIDDPNEERDGITWVRESWLRNTLAKGLRVKVVIDEGRPVGFAHCLPIVLGAWGMFGYFEVARQGSAVIMLKAFEPVDPPVMHKLNYRYQLVPGKVVVDAFWNPICLTSILEIHRVREVCAEYGDRVILNEFNCGNKNVLERYQTSRALFINGAPKDWGYAAPRDELRNEIDRAF